MAHEVWRDVVGYEGLYQVSNIGRVKSLDRTIVNSLGHERTIQGVVLRQTFNSRYYCVSLCRNGETHKRNVHRIVAEAFLEHVDGKDYVDHINGDRKDNRAENLRWVTVSENNYHIYELGHRDKERMCEMHRERIKRLGTPTPPKAVIRNDGVVFESVTAAAMAIGSSEGNVSAVARGKRHTCMGYSFKFIEQGV